jgi:hypothetical protein
MLLDREDIQALLPAYLDLLVRHRRHVSGEAAGPPPLAEYLREQGVQGIDGIDFTVSVAHFDSETAQQHATKEAKDNCRLVCRSTAGGTDCFWVCH